MRGLASSITLSPTAIRPIPEREILWGGQSGGTNRFPENIGVLAERRFADDPICMKAFGSAVSQAQERVWVVDEYLLVPDLKSGEPSQKVKQKVLTRIATILEWFPPQLVASDIRFLTKKHAEIQKDEIELFHDQAKKINSYSTRRRAQCSIQIKTHLTRDFDYIHDRFAVIDDELWHFGGTVGGFHSKVSAASRGWRASEHGAVDFFTMAWEAGEKE